MNNRVCWISQLGAQRYTIDRRSAFHSIRRQYRHFNIHTNHRKMYSDIWPPVHVFLDWDGTLTKKDTLQILTDIGYKRNPTSRPWSGIVQAYLDDYTAHEKSYSPSREQRKTIAEESAWLASLDVVENRSFRRVQDAGIFASVTKSDILSAANRAVRSQSLSLRGGWTKLLFEGVVEPPRPPHLNLGRDGVRFHILSVNWSAFFIKSAIFQSTLFEYGLDLSNPDTHPALKALIPMVHFANELGSILRPTSGPEKTPTIIRTSADKCRILTGYGRLEGVTLDPVKVCVGDSTTDFDALLCVDIGICIRDEPMGSSQKELAETLERIGITVRPLCEFEWPQPAQEGPAKTLWWTEDLTEVSEAISKILKKVENWPMVGCDPIDG
jgi:thiamine phosphate phosphatase / amino-HMP aminohydrolase